MAEFKDRLREAMQSADKNQSDLARETGITQSSISDWLKGKYLAKQDKVDILSQALGVSPSWLMGMDTDPKILPIKKKRLPLLGNIACGEPIFASNDEWQGWVEASDDIEADFCLRAKGDSMINARIHDGDIVFIRKQSIVDNGQIAGVLIDHEATLKRMYYDRENNIVQLVAENPSYPPLVYAGEKLNEIRVLGLAVAFQSSLL